MKCPSIPEDEQGRLETLRALDVLDTSAEERFDRVTRIAKKLFCVPIALVSLVDENRQWFKSYQGLSVNETPRDVSFCGHAILSDDIFMIPDALADERFVDNPMVVNEPHIRFYAGCPLRMLNGKKVGTLCLIDQKPRSLSEQDLDLLRDLAAITERELMAVQLATLDDLTQLSNRRGFLSFARYAIEFCQRHEIPASLVFLDLDQFKLINDTFGHAEGDWVLRVFADCLKQTFRNSDLFARLGGDEFVVLLSNSSKQVAQEAVARLQQSIELYNQTARSGYRIAFSCGILEFAPKQHRSVEDLLAGGDQLMYQIKKAKLSTPIVAALDKQVLA